MLGVGSRSVSANLQLEGHTLSGLCHMKLHRENLTHAVEANGDVLESLKAVIACTLGYVH